jgi:hypothetical protein
VQFSLVYRVGFGSMIDCDLQPTADGRFRCIRCGWEYPKLVHRNCPGPEDPAIALQRVARRTPAAERRTDQVTATAVQEIPVVGPGTELKLLLRKFFIREKPGCGCDEYAEMMNIAGPDWCKEHFEEIVDRLEREAKKRRLPFVRTLGRIVVHRAIRNARKKLEMLKR